MKKRRMLAAIAFQAAAMLLVTGCASTAAGTKGPSETNAPATEPPAQTTESPKVTEPPKVLHQAGGEWIDSFLAGGELPSLKEEYADLFSFGVGIERADLAGEKKNLITKHFNSITCGNEMKADFTLDRKATIAAGDDTSPVVNMAQADVLLKFAKENGLKMRGHTLVWHSQTPRWLFAEDYSTASDAPLISRERMLVRMENYIRQVIEHVNTEYPGIVYAWDVVNEAVEIPDGRPDGLRVGRNYWLEVLGDDYIEVAFTLARKYATPDQTLFYNDYNSFEKSKMYKILDIITPLKEKGLIDGMGMQGHMKPDYPSLPDFEFAVRKYGELGIEVQVTEIDIDEPDNSDRGQMVMASRYKRVMTVLKNIKESGAANITNVTIWGLTDDRTWLSKPGAPRYPLLFDGKGEPKYAFFGMILHPDIKMTESHGASK